MHGALDINITGHFERTGFARKSITELDPESVARVLPVDLVAAVDVANGNDDDDHRDCHPFTVTIVAHLPLSEPRLTCSRLPSAAR